MILHTLGTSAGTQPFEGYHHTCLAIETDNNLYWLDAGECGTYTARISGIDILKTRAIFITHPHMDHVGGLGNLLWYIRKMNNVTKKPLYAGNIDIFTPCLETVEGFMTVLKNTEGDFQCNHTHTVHKFTDGVIYENEEIRVTAIHTNHLPAKDNEYKSYAFIIECEGKKIVFTGDLKLEDLEYILPDYSDALLIETGHHRITGISDYLKTLPQKTGKIYFVHHGGYIMRDRTSAVKEAYTEFGDRAIITADGKSYTI